MVACDGLPELDPGEALGPAADRLGASSAPGLPVVSDGRLAGILTRLAVGRTVHERVVAAAGRGGS
jgi:CBS domain-containing protein